MPRHVVGDNRLALEHRRAREVVQVPEFQFARNELVIEMMRFLVPGNVRQGETQFVRGAVGVVQHFVQKSIRATGRFHQDVEHVPVNKTRVVSRNEQALRLAYRTEQVILRAEAFQSLLELCVVVPGYGDTAHGALVVQYRTQVMREVYAVAFIFEEDGRAGAENRLHLCAPVRDDLRRQKSVDGPSNNIPRTEAETLRGRRVAGNHSAVAVYQQGGFRADVELGRQVLLALFQSFLHSPAFRDIQQKPAPGDAAVGPFHRVGDAPNPLDLPVVAQHPEFQRPACHGIGRRLNGRPHAGHVIGVHILKEARRVRQFLHRPSEEFLRALAHERHFHRTVRMANKLVDTARHFGDDIPEPLLALMKRALRFP